MTTTAGQLRRPAAKLHRTDYPGIYIKDRAAKKFVVIYHTNGRQRKEFARTLAQAKALKAARTTDLARGEFQAQARIKFCAYLTSWVKSYSGRGRRGFRENTRERYKQLIDNYACRYFPERSKLTGITPLHIAEFIRWLADEETQGRRLSDQTIKNILTPIRAALATARTEGLIRHNPANGLSLPHRPQIESADDDSTQARALSREQVSMLLSLAPSRYSLFIELLASTGLRVSEAVALQRADFLLAGSRASVRVRRAYVRGRFAPPKTKHGARSVPLPQPLVFKLRVALAALSDDPRALLFTTPNGKPLDADDIRRRVLNPILEEINAPTFGWHILRHTFCSLSLANGVNIVQLSRMLGHHSPAFTLNTYSHLLPGDELPALDLTLVQARVDSDRLVAVASIA